jgi:hypothetical protein
MLEDFHSGKVPSSPIGDYSDVKVVTPSREIEWDELSRLSDAEMKRLMIDVVDHCSTRTGDHGKPQAQGRGSRLK